MIASRGRPRYAPFSAVLPAKWSEMLRVQSVESAVSRVGTTRFRRSVAYVPSVPKAELQTPIQTGENLLNSYEMAQAIALESLDYVMPDVQRIGGVTGWLRAAALAAAHRIEMSSHLYPEASAHLLAATPTCHFLEYVDWADKIVEEPLQIVDGFAVVPQRPGTGITWNRSAVDKYRLG